MLLIPLLTPLRAQHTGTATISKEIGLDKPVLQHPATPRNRCRRIVFLEKVAGLSLVGHSPKHSENGGEQRLRRLVRAFRR
jgi:hypothetical protein